MRNLLLLLLLLLRVSKSIIVSDYEQLLDLIIRSHVESEAETNPPDDYI